MAQDLPTPAALQVQGERLIQGEVPIMALPAQAGAALPVQAGALIPEGRQGLEKILAQAPLTQGGR